MTNRRLLETTSLRADLVEVGIIDTMMYPPRRRQPVWQNRMNVSLTPIRCQVERLHANSSHKRPFVRPHPATSLVF
jgi:hypothetical protein